MKKKNVEPVIRQEATFMVVNLLAIAPEAIICRVLVEYPDLVFIVVKILESESRNKELVKACLKSLENVAQFADANEFLI